MISMDKINRLEEAAHERDNGQYSRAATILEEVLETWGPDADVMMGLAQVEYCLEHGSHPQRERKGVATSDLILDHEKQALAWIKQAILLEPDRPDFYFELAVILKDAMITDYQGAAEAIRKAIDVEPYHFPSLEMLAILARLPESGVDWQEAIACCERAVHVRPTRGTWELLSWLYRRVGRDEERLLAWKRSLVQRRRDTYNTC